MDFWRTLLVLFRRWYITIPAFVMSLWLAGAAYSAVPVEYQSNAVLVLTTPLTGGTETTHTGSRPKTLTNPMMNFDPSLALSAAIVIQQMNTSETAHRLGVTFGNDTSYEVSNGSSNPELLETGPFIFIGGTGPSPKAAQDVATSVAAMAAAVLNERQNELHAPPSTHINLQVVVPPAAGLPLSTSPLRAAGAAGALAAMAGLAAAYGFESLMTHRQRRRAERERAAQQDDLVPTGADKGEEEGVLAIGASTRRLTLGPPSSARLFYEIPAATAGHRTNGVAPSTANGTVGVLKRAVGHDDDTEPTDPSAPASETDRP
jgi:hypothetical protein